MSGRGRVGRWASGLGVASALSSPGVFAQPKAAAVPATGTPAAEEAEREAYRREVEANYRRNKFGIAVALRRANIELPRGEENAWGGYAGGDFLIPLQDGLSPLWDLGFGFEVFPLEEGTLLTMPVSIAYGFCTPTLLGYAGGIFGAAIPIGSGHSEGGTLFGALAAVGVDLGRAHITLEGRWERGLLKAGQTITVLSVGPQLGIAF